MMLARGACDVNETVMVKHGIELIFSMPMGQIHNQISLAQNTNTCTDTSSASHDQNIVFSSNRSSQLN